MKQLNIKLLIKKVKKIREEANYQEYGWSDLEDDLDRLIEYLEKFTS